MHRRQLLIGFATLALLTLGHSAQAGYNGNLGLVANVTNSFSGPSDFQSATSFSFTNPFGAGNEIVSTSSGAFNVISAGTTFTSTSLDLTNLAGFSLSSASDGTFQAIANDGTNVSEVVTHTGAFLDVYLIGNYTSLPGNTPETPASLRISINYSGSGTPIASFTLAVPPAPAVPEPASFVMVALGMGGLVAVRRYRRRAV